jgi:hypothetical protein
LVWIFLCYHHANKQVLYDGRGPAWGRGSLLSIARLWQTYEDVEWSDNMVIPGEYRTYNLVTDVPYSAGQWVPIRAGILDIQDGVCDDMSFFGEIKNRWILLGVWVSAINP